MRTKLEKIQNGNHMKAARRAAGYKNVDDAADAFKNWSGKKGYKSTFKGGQSLEKRENRRTGMTDIEIRHLAEFYGVSTNYLRLDRGEPYDPVEDAALDEYTREQNARIETLTRYCEVFNADVKYRYDEHAAALSYFGDMADDPVAVAEAAKFHGPHCLTRDGTSIYAGDDELDAIVCAMNKMLSTEFAELYYSRNTADKTK